MKHLASLAAALLLGACAGEAPPDAEQILWAWERPEDLSFLAPGEAKVALLVATIRLEGENLEIYGRRQRLKLPSGLVPIPVVRIETKDPSLGDSQLRQLVQELKRRADPRVSPALQIDFDAKKSERIFYRALLAKLAGELGAGSSISITALASWCEGDRWLADAPILEAVPMLFDMGGDGPALLQKLQRGQDFTEPLCRKSYGVATGEPWPPFRPGRPLYLFSDRRWTRERLRNAANSPR